MTAPRYERCICCGERYNVSVLQEIPPGGYECPKCYYNRKRDERAAYAGPKQKRRKGKKNDR